MTCLRLVLIVTLLAGMGSLRAQQELPRLPIAAHPAYSAPPGTVEEVLQEMTSRAGVIFAGTVNAVRLPAVEDQAANAAAGIVEIEFQVEQAVLGPPAGSTYIVREWAGLWRDAPRFEAGQRRLMLLRSPGPGGLSSPVDGLDGAIPVTGGDLVSLSSRVSQGMQARVAVAAKAVKPVESAVSRVDLRWLQAKALRSVSDSEAQPVSFAPVALSHVAMGHALGGVSNGTSGIGATDVQPELEQVLGMLITWQGSRHAAP